MPSSIQFLQLLSLLGSTTQALSTIFHVKLSTKLLSFLQKKKKKKKKKTDFSPLDSGTVDGLMLLFRVLRSLIAH
jgi:hypothetical protein